jgi:outer membrane protein OmpA-like peptidoglycan-associated protein
MRQLNRFLFRGLAVCLCAMSIAACSSPNSQLTLIQQDKEQLLAAIREQRDANRSLRGQVVSLESRLDEAEKELARSGGGTRISSKPGSPLPATRSDAPPPTRSEPLPWRAPPAKSGSSNAPATGDRKLSGPSLDSARGSLAALAERDSRVQLDGRAGRAVLKSPLAFDEKHGTLTAESKRQLDQVAKLLRSEDARDLQITIAGPGNADRAQAVADYLDRHGIAQERLSVNTGSGVSPAAMRGNAAGDVQIYLSETEQAKRR